MLAYRPRDLGYLLVQDKMFLLFCRRSEENRPAISQNNDDCRLNGLNFNGSVYNNYINLYSHIH